MLYTLADDVIPDGMSDVLILPISLTLLGCAIYFGGWWIEKRWVKSPWRWLGLIPLGYGMWSGWNDSLSKWLGSPAYHSLVSEGREKKMLAAHWGAVLIPLLALTGIVLFHFFNHKLDLGIEDE